MASYRVDLSRSARKELRALDRQWVPRVFAAVESLGINPRPPGYRKMEGYDNSYRIRIGIYRVIYEIQDDVLVVLVVKIGPRGNVYR